VPKGRTPQFKNSFLVLPKTRLAYQDGRDVLK
jgi:hypothetical protein